MSAVRRRAAAGLLTLGLVAPVVLGVLSSDAAAADSTPTIDHAQPTDGGVRLLLSVPGTGAVDLAGVRVQVDGEGVSSTAVTAASTDAVRRTTVLAIDTSASMRGARIAAAKEAANAYLATVPANVQVGVVTFDASVSTRVPPTLDRRAARAAIATLGLSRDTALYQGVLGALRALGPGGEEAGQRKVLVLSDGKDTTDTPLASVVSAIQKSGASVDVVSLQQGDEASAPLTQMAQAGKGDVLSARNAAALTRTFAGEADALGRQIVVDAQVPLGGKGTSGSVQVDVGTAGGESWTTAAYVPIRAEAAPVIRPTAVADPAPVTVGRLAVTRGVVLGGIGAIAVGLLGVVVALGMSKPQNATADTLRAQMLAYGANVELSGGHGRPSSDEGSIATQATNAAARALASNRGLEARIAERLEGAGVALRPAEWLLVHGGIAVAVGCFGLLVSTGSLVLGLLLVLAGVVGPWVHLGLKKRRRLGAFSEGLPDTLQLMSASLSAGLSLAQSIDTIVREGSEPITGEFKRVMVESRLGVTLEDSLEGVARRMESRDFDWVVMAIRIQREVGGNLSELLLNVAATLREREFLRRHVKALSAEGRLSAYILAGLPPLFLLYLTLTKPDYVHPLYSTGIGFVLLAGMGLLLGVGMFWMMKMAKVDLS